MVDCQTHGCLRFKKRRGKKGKQIKKGGLREGFATERMGESS